MTCLRTRRRRGATSVAACIRAMLPRQRARHGPIRAVADGGRVAAVGGTRAAMLEEMSEIPSPPVTRRARLWEWADERHVPLQAILVTVGVVVLTLMAGKIVYKLRDVLLLMAVAGFIALLLNPLVVLLQRGGSHDGATPWPSSRCSPCWPSPGSPMRSATRWPTG